MALQLATDTIFKFIDRTGFNIQTYVLDYKNFMANDYSKIVNYYAGQTEDLSATASKALRDITNESQKLEDVLINITEFDRLDDWELVYFIDTIRCKIKTINKISKFLRSAKYEGFNESTLNIDHTFADNETPEMVAALESDDPDNAWVDILRKNHVLETDYTSGVGGWTIMLGRDSLTNYSLNSVVDNLQGDNVYGKDIDINMVYEDDDLKVLAPRETLRQSVYVLSQLRQGDIPEFVEMGLSENMVIGGNIGVLNVPFIVRQMTETFKTDDTLTQLQVKKVETIEASLYIEFDVNTFRSEVESASITI